MMTSAVLGWETEAENAETHLPKIKLGSVLGPDLAPTRAGWLWSYKGPLALTLLCERLESKPGAKFLAARSPTVRQTLLWFLKQATAWGHSPCWYTMSALFTDLLLQVQDQFHLIIKSFLKTPTTTITTTNELYLPSGVVLLFFIILNQP